MHGLHFDRCRPQTDRWLALMAKGFTRGEIVVGYCGVERGKGFANYMMRAWRMMHGVDWIARAVRRNPYRGRSTTSGLPRTSISVPRGSAIST